MDDDLLECCDDFVEYEPGKIPWWKILFFFWALT